MTIKVQGNVIFDANRVANIRNVLSIAAGGSLRVSSDDSFQGTVAGYTSGGYVGPAYSNVIDKFPFATDTNATSIGGLTQGRYLVSAQSSAVSGYTSGGNGPGVFNTIDKFPFSVDTNATDVGDLLQAARRKAGQSSFVSGYSSGGTIPTPAGLNTIDKFPFSADSNATDVGDLTQVRSASAGQSSTVSGYTSGGYLAAPSFVAFNTIDKFPFATDTNSTDVGDLTQARPSGSGQSSTTHGYTSGGSTPTEPIPIKNTIDKFSFASDTNATDVGDLSAPNAGAAGQSSTTSGYSSSKTPLATNIIDKFPFSSDTNATDIGNLSLNRSSPSGGQQN